MVESRAAGRLPGPDHYSFGLTVEAQITAIQNGQADWTLEAPPADRLGELGTEYAKQVHINPLTAFWYVPMNTRLAPFNNLKARQAVNYAIDRRATVNLFGGPILATPSVRFCRRASRATRTTAPTRRTPARAGRRPTSTRRSSLVKESGTAGQKVVVITPDDEVNKDMGVYLQSVLNADRLQGERQADLREHLLHLRPEHEEQGPDQRPAVVPGLPGRLGLPLHPVRLRVLPSGQRLEHQHRRLLRQGDQQPHAQGADLGVTNEDAANAEWAKIDHMVTDQAPMATLFNPKHIDFVSKRVGNFTFSKQFYWLVSQSWVQ